MFCEKIPEQYAAEIYEILVKHCDASTYYYDIRNFMDYATLGKLKTYRCCPKLGFSGMFHNNNNWWVSSDKKVNTEESKKIVEFVNSKLKKIRKNFERMKRTAQAFKKENAKKSKVVDDNDFTSDSVKIVVEQYLNGEHKGS
jgi:hypothetical protein